MTFELVPPGTYVDAEGFGPYRYLLLREWNPAVENLAVVMLNPSTADAYVDDPTIRRVTAFAKRDGWGGIAVMNLYAWRATVPADLERDRRAGVDVVGPENTAYLRRLAAPRLPILGPAARHRSILVAWGTRPDPERVAAFRALVPDNPLLRLGTTKEGHPRHPLYVRGDTPMIPWPPRAVDA